MACDSNRSGRYFQSGYISNLKTNAVRNIYQNGSISKYVLIQFANQYQ